MTSRIASSVDEIDVLRGLAIVLMIVNHSGNEWLGPALAQGGLLSGLVFIGSFAPVVFFFSTGFGVALSTRNGNGSPDVLSALWKAALLLVADQMLFWKVGAAWGLDFLGFIAFSMLVVTAVAKYRRPVALSLALLVALVVLRYGLGPLMRSSLAGGGFLAWVVGVSAIEHVSYPLTSWLVYPLLGFVAGRWHRPIQKTPSGQRQIVVALGVAAVFLSGAGLMYLAGMGFFRWGVVSAGYLILSIGVLFVAAALAMLVCIRWPHLVRWLSARGTASLAVVPIHYGLLDLSLGLLQTPVDPRTCLLLMLLLIVSSLAMSRLFARELAKRIANTTVLAMLIPLGAVLLASSAWLLCMTPSTWAASVACTAGQLAVAGVVALRTRRKAGAAQVQQPVLSQRGAP